MKKKKIIGIIFIIMVVVAITIVMINLNNKSSEIKQSKISKIEASEITTYKIIFDENGGSTGPADMVSDGGNITIPSVIPKRSGYAFIQWKVRGTNVAGRPNQTFYNVKDYANSDGEVIFEANWGYKITFDPNGGLGEPSEMVSEGGNITVPSIVPERNKYAFLQWKVRGTDIAGRPDQTFYKIEEYVNDEGILDFVANWGYKITFDSNGGIGEPSEMVSEGGNIIIPPETSEREGYTFLQWRVKGTNIAGRPNQTFYKVEEYVNDNGILEFEADWGSTIEYNANGGTETPTNQIKRVGESIELSSEVPVREGYKFLGWSTDNNAVEPTYTAGSQFSEDKNVVLYAVWAKEEIVKATYTIIYNANGGTNGPANQTKQEGEIIRLSEIIPTRSGYKFLGWSTNSSATIPTYANGAEFSKDENTTLYAIWEKEKTDTGTKNDIEENTIIVNNTIENDTSNVINNTIKNELWDNNVEQDNEIEENNIIEDNEIEDNEIQNNIVEDENIIDGENDIDENKIDKNSSIKNSSSQNSISVKTQDNTKAKTILPKAGLNTLKRVLILVIVISLIFGFKYKSTKLS